MKLKELEKNLNLLIEAEPKTDENFESMYSCLWSVSRKLRLLLEKEYNNDILCNYTIRIHGQEIRISRYGVLSKLVIKVKKETKKFRYGLETKYRAKSVIIDDSEFESIENYFEYCEKSLKKREDYKKNQINKFENFLKEKNISVEEFSEMESIYHNYRYYMRIY